jgi:hypothetical protein
VTAMAVTGTGAAAVENTAGRLAHITARMYMVWIKPHNAPMDVLTWAATPTMDVRLRRVDGSAKSERHTPAVEPGAPSSAMLLATIQVVMVCLALTAERSAVSRILRRCHVEAKAAPIPSVAALIATPGVATFASGHPVQERCPASASASTASTRAISAQNAARGPQAAQTSLVAGPDAQGALVAIPATAPIV